MGMQYPCVGLCTTVQGAVSAPVFQNMGLSQISMGKLLKMGAMALNGVTPTEVILWLHWLWRILCFESGGLGRALDRATLL